jgi:hypothetical protein
MTPLPRKNAALSTKHLLFCLLLLLLFLLLIPLLLLFLGLNHSKLTKRSLSRQQLHLPTPFSSGLVRQKDLSLGSSFIFHAFVRVRV